MSAGYVQPGPPATPPPPYLKAGTFRVELRLLESRMKKATEVVDNVVYKGWTADQALQQLRFYGLLDDEVVLNNATEAMRLRDEARDDPAALRHDLRPGGDVKAYAEVVQAAQEVHLQDALEVIAGVTPS